MTKTCMPFNKRNLNASQSFSEFKIKKFQKTKAVVVHFWQTKLVFTCSKSTIETLKKVVKYVKS